MNFIKSLKIGPRLGLAFFTVLLLMVIVSITGFIGISKVSDRLRSVYEDRTVPVGQLAEIQYIFVRNRVLTMDMLARATPENIEKRSTELKANLARSAELLKAYGETALTATEAADFKEFQSSTEKSLLDLESRKSEILLGKIHKAVQEVARKEGVSVVVDKGSILYGHNAVDLTEKVLRQLKGT